MSLTTNGTTLEALPGQDIRPVQKNNSGLITEVNLYGATAPGSALTQADIFAHGCLCRWVGSGSGNSALYENTGTEAVPSWNLIGAVSPGEITLAEGNILIGNNSGVATSLDLGNTNAGIPIGNGTTATINALSGDVTMTNAGVVTVANGAITNAKVADSAGTGTLAVMKSALVVYDFAVDGGAQGAIALTGSPTIPDNAFVWCDSYEVLTTCTSNGADAGTITLGFPTDGDLFAAIAISDASNPWDAGNFVQGLGALVVASQTPKKLTGARTFQITVAGGNDLTAGKIVFHVNYWVSQ